MAEGDISSKENFQHDEAKRVATEDSAADDVAVDPYGDLTLWQAMKKWRRVVVYSICLTSVITMYGFDYVIVGSTTAMPSFQQDYGEQLNGEWILPSLWLGLWTFISPGGAVLGSFFGGWLQDVFGRKRSLSVGTVFVAAGVATAFASSYAATIADRRGIYLAGKAIEGAAIGMVMTITQTYVSEVAPPILRGPLLAFFPTFTLLGQLVGAGVLYACLDVTKGYAICFAMQWPFSGLAFVLSFVIPESPTYLVRKNDMAGAYKAQKRLDGRDIATEDTIRAIERNIEQERKRSSATYVDLFNKANFRRTMIVLFSSVMPQTFGITLLSNASYFGQTLGMSATLSLMLLILGIVCGLLANFASIWILTKVGRRRLIVVSFGVLAVLWLAMGISGFWPYRPAMWYALATMISVIVVAGLSVWPASYTVSSEASALHLRGKAQGLGWLFASAAAAFFGFVLPWVYNPDNGDAKEKTAFVYGGLCAIGCVLAYFQIPEMKDRTPAEIDAMFDLKLPAREFSTWVAPNNVYTAE